MEHVLWAEGRERPCVDRRDEPGTPTATTQMS